MDGSFEKSRFDRHQAQGTTWLEWVAPLFMLCLLRFIKDSTSPARAWSAERMKSWFSPYLWWVLVVLARAILLGGLELVREFRCIQMAVRPRAPERPDVRSLALGPEQYPASQA